MKYLKKAVDWLKSWYIPIGIFLGALYAARRATSLNIKAEQAEQYRRENLQDFLDERTDDVEAAQERFRQAQQRAKEATDHAKKRAHDLANSDDTLSDMLDQYRRDRVRDTDDAARLGSSDAL